jgi:hypothetical protein
VVVEDSFILTGTGFQYVADVGIAKSNALATQQ